MFSTLNIFRKSHKFIKITHEIKFSTSNKFFCQVNKNSLKLSDNMSLSFCQVMPQFISRLNQNKNDFNNQQSLPLVVLLTWLSAKEKHIEKYRSIYLERGFDVLTVETSPIEVLLPTIGAKKIARNCVDVLEKQLPVYDSIVIHAFSVGAYLFGEVILEIENKKREKIAKQQKFHDIIKGVIFDSAYISFENKKLSLEEISLGIAASISINPVLNKLLKALIAYYLLVFRSIATKHYEKSLDCVWNINLQCPSLILTSKNDTIGSSIANEKLCKAWQKLGIHVTYKCWEKSGHVQNLYKYPNEYKAIINDFLNKIKLNYKLDNLKTSHN